MSSENFGSNKTKPLSQIGWAHDCNFNHSVAPKSTWILFSKFNFLVVVGGSFSKMDH